MSQNKVVTFNRKGGHAKPSLWHHICANLIILAIVVNAIVMTACIPFEGECSILEKGKAAQLLTELRDVKLRSWEYICIYNPSPNEKALFQFNYFVLFRGKALLLLQGNDRFFAEIRFWHGDWHRGLLVFGPKSLNRVVRGLNSASELQLVRFILHLFDCTIVDDSYGRGCTTILPNCFNCSTTIIYPGQRQLKFPVGVNYFSRPTTIKPLLSPLVRPSLFMIFV